jgi:hypothetical protein
VTSVAWLKSVLAIIAVSRARMPSKKRVTTASTSWSAVWALTGAAAVITAATMTNLNSVFIHGLR